MPEAFDKLDEVNPDISGSHNDLFPTLFELSLSNASYYNFGQPLMEKTTQTAYGWADQGAYVFSDGVADNHNNSFYYWSDEDAMLLDAEPSDTKDNRSNTLRQESFRRLLNQYLLVQDYRQQTKKQ